MFKSWLEHPTLLADPRERVLLQNTLEENPATENLLYRGQGSSARNSFPESTAGCPRAPLQEANGCGFPKKNIFRFVVVKTTKVLQPML